MLAHVGPDGNSGPGLNLFKVSPVFLEESIKCYLLPDSMTTHSPSPRAAAIGIVLHWLESGLFPQREVGGDTPDYGMVLELVQGTVRRCRTLGAVQDWLVPRKPARTVEAALLVGLYQVFYQPNAAAHALVNETVEAARAVAGKGAAPLVNAVLRRALREKDDLLKRMQSLPFAIRLSHPDLLVERWRSRWNADAVEALCDWNNQPPHVTIRLCPSAGPAAEFRDRLASDGIMATAHPEAGDRWLQLPRGVAVTNVTGFESGQITVQDASTRWAVALLDPQPGERILDLCAAPGGKTAMIAERVAEPGVLVALDLHADRLALLRGTLRRLRHDGVRVEQADAQDPDALVLLEGAPFDRVLLDAPCTNTGVIRRRPDTRWRFSQERLKRLLGTQRKLLDAASSCVKPGGCLVYSTCSLEQEENEHQVSSWLETNPSFIAESSRCVIPPGGGTDGAYAVRIRRD